MKNFDYVSPAFVRDAVSILSSSNGKAKILAGGTDLMNLMRKNIAFPDLIVSLKNIEEIRKIEKVNNSLSIGAACPLKDILESKTVQKKYKILNDAIQRLGTIQTRNRATIGGNICNASPAADTAAPLLVLNAVTIIQGPNGERRVPIAQFFTGPNETVIESNEILTNIILPEANDDGEGIYLKLGRRRGHDCAIIGLAVYLLMNKRDGKINDIRIAVSSAAPTPRRIYKAEKCLLEKIPEKELIEASAIIVSNSIDPITDIRASKEYRKKMAKILTIQAVEKLVSKNLITQY